MQQPAANLVPANPTAVSFWQALAFWFKLGWISFGGPAGQIAIMHQELVERRQWLSERRFLHALNYCMLLPGPEAQQLATYIGWLMHRTWGGILAGLLFVLPSLFLLILLAWLYLRWGDSPWGAGLFYGIKPVVAAIVLHAVWRLGRRVLTSVWLLSLALVAWLAMGSGMLPFPIIIMLAGVTGYLLNCRASPQSGVPDQSGLASTPLMAKLSDAQIPEHCRFRRQRLIWVLVSGGLLWCLPMAGLYGLFGWAHDFTQMAWFFTKAALLTFGGAYAVLPYVYQGAVLQYGWVSPVQMMDGLALGETTPGPLIMVVAFVAFVGGYVKALLGPDQLFMAGALAAVLVTWFTFLPSFIFILAGGPLVESSQQNLRWSGPLTAISAAVVGVMLNLALFFGYHLLWPQGWAGQFDGLAGLMAAVALLALLRFKLGIMPLMALGGLAGIGLQL